jgi:hypothetical protein
LNFTGGDLTEIPTRNHNDLQTIQGGSATDRQHLTTAQVTAIATNTSDIATNTSDIATIKAEIAAGLTVTIATAKLTTGGVNGSMTFTHGILTAQTAAT